MKRGDSLAVNYVDNNAFVQQIIDKGIAEANKRNTNEMGKEEFLNLLILQLRYQDPLNPVDDKEFIAQMAQFSALEQMQAMNASNTAMKGFSMIGKYVMAQIPDSVTGHLTRIEGHVESVVMNGSRTFVVVGGKEIPIDNIYNVADGYNPLNSTLSAYTGLIGYYVKGAVFDLTTGEIVGVNGEVVSLAKGPYEDFAMLNGVNVTIAGVNKNGTIIEDRTKIREYLEGFDDLSNPEERHIEIFIMDENGSRVPIGATLRSYEYDPVFGTIKAVLDDVAVPVASVAAIQKVSDSVVAIPPETTDEDDEDGEESFGNDGPAGTGGVSNGGAASGGEDDGGLPVDGIGADGAPGAGAGAEDAPGSETSADGAQGSGSGVDGAAETGTSADELPPDSLDDDDALIGGQPGG